MFTHEEMLYAINMGLHAVGRKKLDGIPVAAPGHAKRCVLGCAYDADLLDNAGEGIIYLPWALREDRDAILAAWQEAGVRCKPFQADAIRFYGGFYEWMRAFDGGHWEQLVVEEYDFGTCTWTGRENPGQRTIPADEIEEDYDFVAREG